MNFSSFWKARRSRSELKLMNTLLRSFTAERDNMRLLGGAYRIGSLKRLE
jgi:hypothetical protein